jgi:hypothetical protein
VRLGIAARRRETLLITLFSALLNRVVVKARPRTVAIRLTLLITPVIDTSAKGARLRSDR